MLVHSSHGACGIAIFMAEITQSGRAVTVVLGSVLCIGQVTGFSLFTLLWAASKVLSLKDRFWSLLQENSSQVWLRTGIPANWLTRCDLLQDAGMSTDYRPAPGRGFLSTHLLTFEAICHQCMGGGGQDFTLTDFSTVPSVSTASYWSKDWGSFAKDTINSNAGSTCHK